MNAAGRQMAVERRCCGQLELQEAGAGKLQEEGCADAVRRERRAAVGCRLRGELESRQMMAR